MGTWVAEVNRLLQPRAAQRERGAQARRTGPTSTSPTGTANPVWRATPATQAGERIAYRFSPQAAHALVQEGLDPIVIDELARASHLAPAELQRFAGVDRTTIKRRADKGQLLSEEAAVKTLTAAELVGLATEVFGSVEAAADWLTTPHPVLEGEAPIARARTPWGLGEVREMLVALRYGGVV